MMKRIFCQTLVTVIVVLGGVAEAGIVLNDGFTYPDGNVVGAPGSPWVQHSGSGAAVIDGGKLFLTTSAGEDINAPLADGPYVSGSTLYASFIVNLSSLPGTVASGGSYLAHFSHGSTGFRCLIWPNRTDAADGMFRIGIRNSNLDAAVTNAPQDLSLNTNHKVVVRYVVGAGISTLWINPTEEEIGGVTATTVPNMMPDITTFAFRQADNIGMSKIDDLLVGTTFNDVVYADLPPTISAINNQSIPADGSTGPVAIVVGDDSTPLAELIVTGASDNQALVPDGNIVFDGTDGNRNVTVTPVAGQQGAATITVTVSDAGSQKSTSFQLRVGAPSIASIENQITPMGVASSPIAVIVDDVEEGASGLVVSAVSDNQQLIADGSIVVGGAGGDREIVLTPSAGQSGVATITVTANDGFQSASTQFRVTVYPELGLLISDNFNRSDGPLVDGLADWTSHSGGYQEMMISGGRVVMSHLQSEDVSDLLTPGTIYDATGGYVFYVGLTVNFSELPRGDGSYLAHFKDDGFSHRARLIATTNAAPTGQLRLGIANAVSEVSAEGLHPVGLSLGTDYMVIVRFNSATGESRLWLNPIEENAGFVDATDPLSPSPVESFALRQDGDPHGMGVLSVDNLLVATSFSDVVGDLPPVIRFSRSGNNLRLSWPSGNGFELRRSTTLPAVNWMMVPMTIEGPDEVTNIEISAGRSFFRLEKMIQ